jgi:ferritin
MMSQRMQDAFNEQRQHEFYSSYLYLSMSAYCDRANPPGMDRWMRVQGSEEAKHAMKIFDHLLDQEPGQRRGAPAAPAADPT